MADPQKLDPDTQALFEKALKNKDQLDPVTAGLLMNRAKDLKLGDYANPTGVDLGRPGVFDRLQQDDPRPMLGQLGDAVKKGVGETPYGFGSPFTVPYELAKTGGVNLLQTLKQLKDGNIEALGPVGSFIKDAYGGRYGAEGGPNIPGMVGDVLAGGLQYLGGKALEPVNAPTRFVGDKMLYTPAVEKVVGMNPDIQTLGKFQDAVDYFKRNELLPKDLEKNQQLMAHASVAKNAALSAATATPTGRAFIGPLLDTAKTYIQSGDPIPQRLLDAMDQFTKSGPRPISFWQDMKEALDRRVRSKSVLSGQGMGEKSLGTQILEQRAQGLRQGIPQFAPGLDEANQSLHLGQLSRKAMENYQMKSSNPTENIPSFVAGALAHELTPGSGGVVHQPLTMAALAAYVTRALTRNPQTAASIGLPMTRAGSGPITLGLGQLARLGLLRSNQSQQEGQ